jgi:hypothetical protein
VIIVGSQAILASWPEAPPLLRRSGEIDAYPENAKQWEALHAGEEASEEINALFGEGSEFHRTHGFYIDGVDETTAALPADWRTREVRRAVQNGEQTNYAVAPELHDLVVSKLCRLDPKDQAFVMEVHANRPLSAATLVERLARVKAPGEVIARAVEFAKMLGGQAIPPR